MLTRLMCKKANTLLTKIGEKINEEDKNRIRIPNNIPGGPAKKTYEDEYNPLKLYVGALDEVEEHTDPSHINYGMEIAADHLRKDPTYYDDELKPDKIHKAKELLMAVHEKKMQERMHANNPQHKTINIS